MLLRICLHYNFETKNLPDVPDDDKLSCSLGFRLDPHAKTELPRRSTGDPPPSAVYRLCPAFVIVVPQLTK
jgi:hypothetical protein